MSGDLFDKFGPLLTAFEGLVGNRTSPFGLRVDRVLSPTEAVIGGRDTILAGTFNYLGLTYDPECVRAAQESVARDGTGTTGSRIANGNYAIHSEVEAAMARFLGRRAAMLFTTGYQANLGILSTLVGPEDHVLLDADCHASIYDGLKMGTATVIRFRHNDVTDLDRRLERLAGDRGHKLIVVEGIYSMLGDRAPLKELVQVKREYGGYLLVDEAHSLGVLGERGRGLVEELGVLADADFIVGTFSKSLGGAGGFCVSDLPELDLVRYSSRPYIFTASPSPATIASTRQALRILSAGRELRARLRENFERLHAGLTALGYTLGASPSPVIAVVLGDRGEALQFWSRLLQRGVYVNLMLPPATPNGVSLIRCSVSAAHTLEQIDAVCAAFADLRAAAGSVAAKRGAAT